MRRLLEEILLYAKPVTPDLQALRPGDLLLRFAQDHRSLAAARNQSIRIDGANTDVEVTADADRLTQVISNLTQNACEAAPEGAEIVWTVNGDPTSGAVTLEVRNPGPPIPPDILPRITEPFFSTKSSGTGLGLAIVRRLTQIQGGELSITSDSTDGTRVRLVFPLLSAGPESDSDDVGSAISVN